MSAQICGTVRVRAHAKINLNLQVLGRRPDGYHELRTVFQALALHDTLRLTPGSGPFTLQSSDARVPPDSTNLVWRAADLLWRHLGRAGAMRDVAIRIEKCIPMKAGLGGGSADAAAALVGLACLWGQDVPAADLVTLGREVGADVPFFLTGGTAFGVGRGDEISPLPDLPPLGVLLVFPSFDVSTAEAYRWLDEDRAEGALRTSGPSDPRTLRVGDIEIANDFEPVVSVRHPQIAGVVTDLLDRGAVAAAMTGSGSTVFGIYERDEVLAAAARTMSRLGYSLTITRTLTRAQYERASAPACL